MNSTLQVVLQLCATLLSPLIALEVNRRVTAWKEQRSRRQLLFNSLLASCSIQGPVR